MMMCLYPAFLSLSQYCPRKRCGHVMAMIASVEVQVARMREHHDCVLLLRQHQTAQAACQAQVEALSRDDRSTDICQGTDSESLSRRHQPGLQQQASREELEHCVTASASSCAVGERPSGGAPQTQGPGGVGSGEGPHTTTTASGHSSCCQVPTNKSPSVSHALDSASWGEVVSKDEGNAWMQAARAGDLAVLEQLLRSNVALLAYRGQGTTLGFGGVIVFALNLVAPLQSCARSFLRCICSISAR
jgi:hypothetical protein